jgi:hypothetical protein
MRPHKSSFLAKLLVILEHFTSITNLCFIILDNFAAFYLQHYVKVVGERDKPHTTQV